MKPTHAESKAQDMSTNLKNWVMIALTLIFVVLYAAALTGWLKPLADEKMVMRLEPIIFVIIGYYFGRLPGQQNEKTLKEEIHRQTQKADAAQQSKEQSLKTGEALEEKLKNVRATLSTATTTSASTAKAAAVGHDKTDGHQEEAPLRFAMNAALNILNS